jgi:hypothetical protein
MASDFPSTVPLGAGMTDIPVGWALWDDLVRQITARARNCSNGKDLPRAGYIKSVRDRVQTPINNFAVIPLAMAINVDNLAPVGEPALRVRPIVGPGNAIACNAVSGVWERVVALSREFPNGEIRRSPGVRGV